MFPVTEAQKIIANGKKILQGGSNYIRQAQSTK